MILLTKGASNEITLTLSEKCDLTNPYFLFSFYNTQTKETINRVLTDTSLFTERYNRFTLIEGTTATFMAGYWEYTVYEQTSSTNTDITLASQIVETGKMKVINATQTAQTIYEPNQTTNTVYLQ